MDTSAMSSFILIENRTDSRVELNLMKRNADLPEGIKIEITDNDKSDMDLEGIYHSTCKQGAALRRITVSSDSVGQKRIKMDVEWQGEFELKRTSLTQYAPIKYNPDDDIEIPCNFEIGNTSISGLMYIVLPQTSVKIGFLTIKKNRLDEAKRN